MHNTRAVFLREIRSFFNSPMAYIFLVIFAIFNGYFFTSTFFLYNQSDLRSLFSVVPTIISALLNKYVEDEFKKLDLTNVRFGRSASSALAPETHKKFEEKFNIIMIETMGLTETCAPILSNPLPPGKIKHGSPGLAYGNEVKILLR